MVKRGGLLVLGALALARPAWGFKEPGHRAIEAAAYEMLLLEGEGKALSVLVRRGALAPPVQPAPDASAAFASQYESFNVEGLSVMSHMPDHHFDRQLDSERQCFHFNARSAFVTDLKTPISRLGNVPRGLVIDAYLECMGVADALLRNVIYDPQKSRDKNIGLYELMHMVEDSFSDSHVARDMSSRAPGETSGKILYVKPWNLRSALRYTFTTGSGVPWWHHFSDRQHMTSETRDAAYALGPFDDEYSESPAYQRRLRQCLSDATGRLPAERDRVAEPATLADLQTNMVLPQSCLSSRAKRAAIAIHDLLLLVSDHLAAAPAAPPADAGRNSPGFQRDWESFRCKHLAHEDRGIANCPESPRAPLPPAAAPPPPPAPIVRRDVRKDTVHFSPDLEPKRFKNAGAGLTTELRSGTPLWLGVEVLSSRDPTSHHELSPFDVIAWGVQVRLPIENELGEKPVGLGWDIGPGLPLPISELFGVDELQLYLGARGRFSYVAQSVFDDETRHTFELGFGGFSLDAVVGGHVWFGLDAPRVTYQIDSWKQGHGLKWQTTFSFSGGVATDAF